jgi:hypothetical protein
MRNEATLDFVLSSIQSSACNPSSHPHVIIIINLNPNGRWQLGIRIRRQLGIGIRFSLLLYNGGGGRGGEGVRPMGRVGFRNKGSMGRGLTLYLSIFRFYASVYPLRSLPG